MTSSGELLRQKEKVLRRRKGMAMAPSGLRGRDGLVLGSSSGSGKGGGAVRGKVCG